MPWQRRIAFLEESHRMLDRQIEKLKPNDPSLVELKKKKLALKDEIIQLKQRQRELNETKV